MNIVNIVGLGKLDTGFRTCSNVYDWISGRSSNLRPCILIFTINMARSMDDWIKWIQFRIIPRPCTIISGQ